MRGEKRVEVGGGAGGDDDDDDDLIIFLSLNLEKFLPTRPPRHLFLLLLLLLFSSSRSLKAFPGSRPA